MFLSDLGDAEKTSKWKGTNVNRTFINRDALDMSFIGGPYTVTDPKYRTAAAAARKRGGLKSSTV